MKKALFFILVPFFFLSCHKHENNSCGGYFIGVGNASSTSNTASGAAILTLFTVNTTNGNIVGNYKASLQVGNFSGVGAFGAYDHVHNNYYLYGWSNATHGVLYNFNTNTGTTQLLGYPTLLDTPTSGYLNMGLACNSTAGKLYFYGSVGSANEIYEVIPSTSSFSQRLVYTSATTSIGFSTGAFAIDEQTGYIYFVSESASNANLMKVDPSSGISTIVASYPSTGNSGMFVSGLVYNNNDGLLYGFNVYNQLYPSPNGSAYTPFISIDPSTGNIKTLNATANYLFGGAFTFDYCNNLYVVFEGQGAFWLDPSNGKIAKQASYPYNSGSIDTSGLGYVACINNPVP